MLRLCLLRLTAHTTSYLPVLPCPTPRTYTRRFADHQTDSAPRYLSEAEGGGEGPLEPPPGGWGQVPEDWVDEVSLSAKNYLVRRLN